MNITQTSTEERCTRVFANKKLTFRQQETLSFIAQGLPNKQIAFKMGISEATVKLHLNAIFHLLGASNRTQALIKAIKQGIV